MSQITERHLRQLIREELIRAKRQRLSEKAGPLRRGWDAMFATDDDMQKSSRGKYSSDELAKAAAVKKALEAKGSSIDDDPDGFPRIALGGRALRPDEVIRYAKIAQILE